MSTHPSSSTDDPPAYVPPTVWTWEIKDDNKFAAINQPTAGARFDRTLPVGKHPLQLYSMGTQNGQKVTIMLEELLEAGVQDAEYDAWLISILQKDQFGSEFVAVNPNSKVPAMMDYSDKNKSVRLFESGSILLYLADKFGHFLPADQRPEVMNWLFWQMGSAPYVGGGFGHFYHYANDKQEYPINRFTMETKRQLDVLNRQLAERTYMVGDAYTIADIAIWPWYASLVLGECYGEAATFLNVAEDYPHVIRWAKLIQGRPGVRRGSIVNTTRGPRYLKERHDATDFDTKVVTDSSTA